ncbi:MAG: bile acid:sodium symporter [Candidatus Aadella gelida]|nr:bile acid:sodium symporter [Candidatus Aadella gelida]
MGKRLLNAIEFVRRNLAYLIPFALIVGLINGHYHPMAYSRVICVSALLIMIFPVFINIEFGKGIKELPKFKGILLLATIVNFVLYPLIAFGLGWLFLREYPAMWLGLVMLSLVPTSGMTINWTYFTKGHMHVAMGIVSIGILVSVVVLPIIIPVFAQHLMGAENINVSKMVILEKLFFIIVLPLIFGSFVRRLILKHKGVEGFKRVKPVNGGISAVGVMVVSFLVMSLKSTQVMVTNANVIFIALVPVLIFYAVIFLISHGLGHMLFDHESRKAFFFGTAARYHVISLGVVLGAFKDYDFIGGVVIMIAVGLAVQIPALAFYAKWIQGKTPIKLEEEIDREEEFI